jgi:hypothetical protein
MAKKKLPAIVLDFFREQGRKGGKLSGSARMLKLTPERRSEIAKKAVAAREAKRAAAAPGPKKTAKAPKEGVSQ